MMEPKSAFFLGAAEGILDILLMDIKYDLYDKDEFAKKLNNARDLIEKAFNADGGKDSNGEDRAV